MRIIISTLVATAMLVVAPVSGAQSPDTAARRRSSDDRPNELPRSVIHDLVSLYNEPGTLRVNGSLEVASDRTIESDVAVLGGPLTVAGRITGRVVVINGDLVLRPSARIEGTILIVGGSVSGPTEQSGDVRVYREPLYYRLDGDTLVAERPDREMRTYAKWRQRRGWSRGEIKLVSAHTYNRVEGLPIMLGPRVRHDVGWGRVTFEALGVLRTADDFRWDSDNLGHAAKLELRAGRGAGLRVGGRVFDVVEGVEQWHLSDAEVGLASFFLHRDYRDYYNRHGGTAYASVLAGNNADVTASYSDERWGSREVRDPLTLSRDDQKWRPNPEQDEGRFHLANLTLNVDTRNDADAPWAGWYVKADYELGRGQLTCLGPVSGGAQNLVADGKCGTPVSERRQYTRGFVDLRRYNRLAPGAQLNARVVLGGWLDGDALPQQRRLSVGGPGTLPGFDFRRVRSGRVDVGQCSNGAQAPGRPAECDRVALAQLEYRADFNVRARWSNDDEDNDGDGSEGVHDRWSWDFNWDPGTSWVVFANAGRGWRVGDTDAGNGLFYSRSTLPPLSTFRTDVGGGFDFGTLGLYVAKSVSDSDEPLNFFVRVSRRF